MATAPAFAATPNIGLARPAATAITDRTGATGTLTTLFTAGASGARVDEVRATQVDAAPAAGSVVVWINDGTNKRYLTELQFTSTQAPGATVAPEQKTATFTSLFLKAGWTLQCAPTVAKTFDVEAFGGDF